MSKFESDGVERITLRQLVTLAVLSLKPSLGDLAGSEEGAAFEEFLSAHPLSVHLQLALTEAWNYPREYSGVRLGVAAALVMASLSPSDYLPGVELSDELEESIRTAALLVAVEVARIEDGVDVDPDGLPIKNAAFKEVLRQRSSDDISVDTARRKLESIVESMTEEAEIQPVARARVPSKVDALALGVKRFLNTKSGTLIRVLVGVLTVVGIPTIIVLLIIRDTDTSAEESPLGSLPVLQTNAVLPDLGSNVPVKVTSWVFRSDKDDTYKSVSGQLPAAPYVLIPGERFYIDVTLEKSDTNVPLPGKMSYAVTTASDTPLNPGSFRLFNVDHPNGLPIADMTNDYTPVEFDRGGGGVTLSFSATAPDAKTLSCGYNLRRVESYLNADGKAALTSSQVAIVKSCG
ncbi:hypothetical protein [Rhodococcus erythropolis]|uniref:hypothetical protein n=1 Tax=Rhodococcus erythropolis TaxID=1833 RepID=UPI001EDEFDA2|nr:hypothetical protein [Rhodococcus erythropolis]